ncbi:methyl-accepting chemotaxis protein [uncultured Tateyamaria sp.]|uniref:methyl-accepting chemotaxis protein n=1 Tax=uncultured Tateyamaria sp. TaxID=455651 RepID=UPI00261AD17E|nr:methyl-accepting chemotaxis protein [uncultured Tateyamaria sp.]
MINVARPPATASAGVTNTDEMQFFAHRRSAIDLVATTRARAIRSALFGAYLFRTNPLSKDSEDTRAEWRKVLRLQYDALVRAAELVQGRDPEGVISREVCNWIGSHGAAHPQHVAAFVKMADLTSAIVDAANTDDAVVLEAALRDHFFFGRGGFFETVTEFCDGLWADLDAGRHAEVAEAMAKGDAIAKTLTRLEHIGKHVRLVSLNASVEAARVGDAGRGLGVIAVEFKTLAEEIQRLATTARCDIAGMTGKQS